MIGPAWVKCLPPTQSSMARRSVVQEKHKAVALTINMGGSQ